MESKIEHFLSNPIILPGITLNSEQILFSDLGPCWEHDWIRLKVLYFGSTIHMGGVTIRKRTVGDHKRNVSVAVTAVTSFLCKGFV